MKLMRTCKEAAALMLAREDRALALGDRVALRLHLAICSACPRFERQLLTMRQALVRWRHYSEGAEEAGKTPTNPPDRP